MGQITDAQTIIDKFDKDSDGKINFEEFVKIMEDMSGNDQTDSKDREASFYKKAFLSFDKNGDGFLSPDELKAVLSQIGEITDKEVNDLIAVADKDGDGKVNVNEFLNVMKPK